MLLIKRNILFVICSIGILQAILVNIIGLRIQLLSLFMLAFICIGFLNKHLHKIRYDALFWLLLAGLVLLLVQGMLINVGDTKEIFMHANVILSLLFAKTITKDKDVEFKVPYVLIWVYMIVSFILYLFYWEPIAIMVSSQYYEGDDIFLSVRTNGFNRSFGLLFNILANGYFLLLIFFITNALHRTKFSLFKIILIFSIALTITRGAIVPMVLFLFLNSIYEKRWALLAAIFLIFTVVYHLFTPATLVVDSILKMEDSQGSAQMHQNTIIDALSIILANPIGVGFKSVWIESWILKYGVIYGYSGLLIFLLFLVPIAMKFLIRKRYSSLILYVSILPIIIILPFHALNLPTTLFFIYIYMLYHNRINIPKHLPPASCK